MWWRSVATLAGLGILMQSGGCSLDTASLTQSLVSALVQALISALTSSLSSALAA
jgi:hypothetical protein